MEVSTRIYLVDNVCKRECPYYPICNATEDCAALIRLGDLIENVHSSYTNE